MDAKDTGGQETAVRMILTDYARVARFLEEETIFRARPLHIVVDGPHSIGASLEVSLSAKAVTSQGS